VELRAFAPAVDQAIIENYAGTLDRPTDKCPASVPDLQSCDSFGNGLSAMCGTTSETVSVGLVTPGSNPFASVLAHGWHSNSARRRTRVVTMAPHRAATREVVCEKVRVPH